MNKHFIKNIENGNPMCPICNREIQNKVKQFIHWFKAHNSTTKEAHYGGLLTFTVLRIDKNMDTTWYKVNTLTREEILDEDQRKIETKNKNIPRVKYSKRRSKK